MDGGPFRAPRSAETDRRVVSRQEPAQRQPQEPQPIVEEPRTYQAAPQHRVPTEVKSRKKRFMLPIIIIVAVIILGGIGWAAWSHQKDAATGIDGSKYQAVFFTNGQVYFGKLQSFNKDYLKLTDIYYLQTQSTDSSSNPQATTSDQNSPTLIKLGDEIHGPEDEMVISKEQVLFYENLKADGKVAQSIDKSKKQ